VETYNENICPYCAMIIKSNYQQHVDLCFAEQERLKRMAEEREAEESLVLKDEIPVNVEIKSEIIDEQEYDDFKTQCPDNGMENDLYETHFVSL